MKIQSMYVLMLIEVSFCSLDHEKASTVVSDKDNLKDKSNTTSEELDSINLIENKEIRLASIKKKKRFLVHKIKKKKISKKVKKMLSHQIKMLSKLMEELTINKNKICNAEINKNKVTNSISNTRKYVNPINLPSHKIVVVTKKLGEPHLKPSLRNECGKTIMPSQEIKNYSNYRILRSNIYESVSNSIKPNKENPKKYQGAKEDIKIGKSTINLIDKENPFNVDNIYGIIKKEDNVTRAGTVYSRTNTPLFDLNKNNETKISIPIFTNKTKGKTRNKYHAKNDLGLTEEFIKQIHSNEQNDDHLKKAKILHKKDKKNIIKERQNSNKKGKRACFMKKYISVKLKKKSELVVISRDLCREEKILFRNKTPKTILNAKSVTRSGTIFSSRKKLSLKKQKQ